VAGLWGRSCALFGPRCPFSGPALDAGGKRECPVSMCEGIRGAVIALLVAVMAFGNACAVGLSGLHKAGGAFLAHEMSQADAGGDASHAHSHRHHSHAYYGHHHAAMDHDADHGNGCDHSRHSADRCCHTHVHCCSTPALATGESGPIFGTRAGTRLAGLNSAIPAGRPTAPPLRPPRATL